MKLIAFASAVFATLSPLLTATPATDDIARKANEFLDTLDGPRRAHASLPFDDADRENWRYTPRERAGLPLKAMTEAQKNAAVALANSILSERGALKAAQVITLEGILAVMEKNAEYRDQEKYYVAIFGTPGDASEWGLRFEGHHLSLNVTITENTDISATPSFMGANPAEVLKGENQGLRPFAAEEDLARALTLSLLEAGKKDVLFSDAAPREILTGESRKATQLEAVGARAADLSISQQDALWTLVREFTGRHRDEISEAQIARIKASPLTDLRFGWAGSTKRGDAYYYRIQSPDVLIEVANTQSDANHIHTVIRDIKGDFARDRLGGHFKQHE
jgi:hypothetical protein